VLFLHSTFVPSALGGQPLLHVDEILWNFTLSQVDFQTYTNPSCIIVVLMFLSSLIPPSSLFSVIGIFLARKPWAYPNVALCFQKYVMDKSWTNHKLYLVIFVATKLSKTHGEIFKQLLRKTLGGVWVQTPRYIYHLFSFLLGSLPPKSDPIPWLIM
jgi:hypothetical protein